MTYHTDEKLKSYLDTNQLHREQMCRAILAIDKRFSDVRPRHPRGGKDGGRDIEAIFREEQTAFGAVGFVNQANDSKEQKKQIKNKFEQDLKSALAGDKKPTVFIFLTNINLTIGEKEALLTVAKSLNITYSEIFDRERLRIALDSPDGFSIRFQYLNIALSEEEQASFFARWGDDIQSVISTGFQRIESSLSRILFLQEAGDPITRLSISFELNQKYDAEEVGHFRLFCLMNLKEPKHKILSLLFGSSDKSNRMRSDVPFSPERAGIKHGISSGQWEQLFDLDRPELDSDEFEPERFVPAGCGSRIGMNEVEFISISYDKDSFIRFLPTLSLRDFDDAMFIPILNKSLSKKIKAIHIYSNGYKLLELSEDDFRIDNEQFEFDIPVEFTPEELSDPWVRIRPTKMASSFHLRFYEQTPARIFTSTITKDSLGHKRRTSNSN